MEELVGGSETVLLVEDEDFVRNVTREVLEISGYKVLEAPDPSAGITLFEQNRNEIDLLITDVVMPGMNGRDFAALLIRQAPTLKTLFISGYTDNAVLRQGLNDDRVCYLQKPFTLEGLTRTVRDVLDRETVMPLEAIASPEELQSTAPRQSPY